MLSGLNGSAPTILVMTPVWGKSFIELFGQIVLPSFLSKGNLGFLGKKAAFYLYTTENDIQLLQRYPSFELLRSTVDLHIEKIAVNSELPHAVMSACEEHAAACAANTNIPAVFLQPDAMLSEGALKRLVELKDAGAHVICVPGIRAAKEGFVNAVQPFLNTDRTTLSIPPRDLVRALLKNLHPISKSLLNNSTEFSSHPSHIYWEIPGNGIVAVCAHLHPILIYRDRKDASFGGGTLDDVYALQACPDFRKHRLILDSDELCVVEISPENKRLETPKLRTLNVADYAKWAQRACKTHHFFYLSNIFLMKAAPISEAWAPAIGQAHQFQNEIQERLFWSLFVLKAETAFWKIINNIELRLDIAEQFAPDSRRAKFFTGFYKFILRLLLSLSDCKLLLSSISSKGKKYLIKKLWFGPHGPSSCHPYYLIYKKIHDEIIKTASNLPLLVISRNRRLRIDNILFDYGLTPADFTLINPDSDKELYQTILYQSEEKFQSVLFFDYGTRYKGDPIIDIYRVLENLSPNTSIKIIRLTHRFDIFNQTQVSNEKHFKLKGLRRRALVSIPFFFKERTPAPQRRIVFVMIICILFYPMKRLIDFILYLKWNKKSGDASPNPRVEILETHI